MDADTRFTVELGRTLSDVLYLNGDRKTADAVLQEVQQFVSPGQPALAAAVLMDQARHVSRRGGLSSAEELLQEALLLLDKGGEQFEWLRCELLYRQGEIAAARGGDERALSLFAEGFALADRNKSTGNDHSWRFQIGLGDLSRNQGEPDDAEAYLSNALLVAEEADSLVGTLSVQIAYADLLMRQEQSTRAKDHLGDAVRCAQRLGDRGMAAQLSLQLGELFVADRDPAGASEHLRRAVTWSRASGRASVKREAGRLLEQLSSAADQESGA